VQGECGALEAVRRRRGSRVQHIGGCLPKRSADQNVPTCDMTVENRVAQIVAMVTGSVDRCPLPELSASDWVVGQV
jgi:hypothetical protein